MKEIKTTCNSCYEPIDTTIKYFITASLPSDNGYRMVTGDNLCTQCAEKIGKAIDDARSEIIKNRKKAPLFYNKDLGIPFPFEINKDSEG